MAASPETSALKPSPLYQAALGLVAGAMLLLPLLYVALIVALGFGVYEFMVHDFVAIWDWPVGSSRYGLAVKFVCAFLPPLAGAVMILFLVKPLFAGRTAHMQPLALSREFEPRVHELAERVCGLLGAPAPVRIEVNCEVNASAGFARGGFFSNRLVLTLGMPLVAGLTERELAGVIAHEFGHFRQGGGMRLSYLIRRVNGWFARVIYERDAWDETLRDASGSDNGWISVMAGGARLGVWLARRVLWILMTAGHAISCLLLRQMEYDADHAEVRVVGAAAFESTEIKLGLLNALQADIHREMQRSWHKNLQLPDNLPVLLEQRVARLSADRRAKLENAATLGRTGWLDTHPSAADRVKAARRLGGDGLDFRDAPARELFEDFGAVSRLVTLAHYQDDLNVPITEDFLIPLESVTAVAENPGASAPSPPAASPVKMMNYDPAAFTKPKDPDSAG